MIHLLIADDHAAVRQGLRLLFELVDDVVVAAEAVDGGEALQAVERGGIDLALIDLSMPGLSGVELIEKIHVFNARLPIVVLSMHSEPQVIQRALVAGASGYLVKGCDSEEIVDTVRRLCAGLRDKQVDGAEHYVEFCSAIQSVSAPGTERSDDQK